LHSTPVIGLNTVVSRSEEPVSAQVDDTVVMMSLEQGMYFGLEGSGSRIWALLEQPRRVDEICETLMQEFEVDADACRSQVLGLLQELAQAQLIRCHDNADGTTAAPDRS
jgi:hypothetical protein